MAFVVTDCRVFVFENLVVGLEVVVVVWDFLAVVRAVGVCTYKINLMLH